jgi:hypothetical protein
MPGGYFPKLKNPIWLFLGIGAFLIITIIITLMGEYIPYSDSTTLYNNEATPFPVLIKRPSTILVPLRNLFEPIDNNIMIQIYNNLPNITITNVKLSTMSDSILSFNDTFTRLPIIYLKGVSNITKSSTATSANAQKLINWVYPVLQYNLKTRAQHNLEVSNTTNPYTINIFYLNSTSGKPILQSLPLTFTWPIKTLDFSLITYFWIVLIGVISSRALSRAIKQKESDGSNKLASTELQNIDYVWILFSFIIALLIFSSFKQQVSLSSHIIANLSAAFAFGFGFDKVLEVAERFKSLS